MPVLQCHPGSSCGAVREIAASALRRGGAVLDLRFVLHARIADLAFPQAAEPARSDGLWQHTCFEVFLLLPGRESYLEFNLAPSGQWAAYSFARPREGMAPLEAVRAIPIRTETAAEEFELAATIDLAGRADYAAASLWQAGLSAVIEERSGRKSYWALAHPPGKPDFHHRDCFALELPAA